MLAYIFWHWSRPEVEAADYERELNAFHQALGDAGAEGFLRSASFRIAAAPWINGGGKAYADWYLVAGSYALDPLNEVAVSGGQREPHNRAAGWAAGGAGGLYRLRTGEPGLAGAAVESWFSKPVGMGYPELYSLLQPLTDRPHVELWRRQMVLGPAPEFCLVASEALEIPKQLVPIGVTREAV